MEGDREYDIKSEHLFEEKKETFEKMFCITIISQDRREI